MKILVLVVIALMAAGSQLLFFREQFGARADRLDHFTDDALQRSWRFTTTSSRRGHHRTDRWESALGRWTAESAGRPSRTGGARRGFSGGGTARPARRRHRVR
jgi:hypothetical protein